MELKNLSVVNCYYVETYWIFIYWLCTYCLVNFIYSSICFEESLGFSTNAIIR